MPCACQLAQFGGVVMRAPRCLPLWVVWPCLLLSANLGPAHGQTAGLVNVALQSQGGTATASSTGTYKFTRWPSMAIDGDRSDGWGSNWDHPMPAWLQVEFNRIYRIEDIGIQWLQHNHTFSVSLSPDGESWTSVLPSEMRSNTNAYPSGMSYDDGSYHGSDPAYQLFSIEPTDAQYIRLTITSTSAPGSHILQARVSELEAYRPPGVFGLFVGVQDDANPSNPLLDYRGDEMATDMSTAFARAIPNFQKDAPLVGDARTDDHPTHEEMECAINDLSTLGPKDTAIIYVTGHGGATTSPEPDDPYGVVFLGDGLTDIHLAGMLDAVPDATPKWVIIDSCHSGAFGTRIKSLPNAALLASAPADEPALSYFGYGLMTWAIKEGLEFDKLGYIYADKDHDGLSFNDLYNWVDSYDIAQWLGLHVQPIGGGDPVLFTAEMWNPVMVTSPDLVV